MERSIDQAGELDRRHRLPPGTRIGDHLIVRGVLGEGGTAIVYEALHTRLGASVALKVIDVSDEFMDGAHARLLREAHVCASLEDPHIPRIYDVGELPDGTPYVVMERVSGRTLENVLLQGALPLDIAVQITEDLLLAVDAIERAGIVHRDIKPPNIILQTNAEGMLRIRLMDFGVSKNVGAEREPTQKTDVQSNPMLTQQGAIVGTPHYMAPEQIVGPTVDSRADLYAVGVVAYEMMSGRTAFEGETTGEVVAAVLHTRPTPLRKLRDVHEALENWVDRAMSQRRSDRFQSARQMREALREAWEQHLDQVGARGGRRWGKRVRVVGALGLVAVGMMLPVPASYDTGL
ncbi:MAG TPA: serine/threonine-protein kinase, partial [Polyangiales bacterium]|nr:serine/threonine-protein kinase [Polyangiales bacterium]